MRLPHCHFSYTDHGCLTVFHGAVLLESVPHPGDPHYHVISHRLGYGDDLMRYCREHDLFHHFCCNWFHGTRSEALWASAQAGGGLPAPAEEVLVMTCQRWVRAGEQPIVGGVDWLRFRAEVTLICDALEDQMR